MLLLLSVTSWKAVLVRYIKAAVKFFTDKELCWLDAYLFAFLVVGVVPAFGLFGLVVGALILGALSVLWEWVNKWASQE